MPEPKPLRGERGTPVHHIGHGNLAEMHGTLCQVKHIVIKRNGDEFPFFCTLPAGHKGAHCAHDSEDHIVQSWPRLNPELETKI
jgi:hypothetical protein